AADAAGAGANPHLDIDDTNGLGPENINIDNPNPATYRIYVHYYGDIAGSEATRSTVRVYLNGVQRAEYRRTLSHEKDLWAVADITWMADDTGTVTPYPSDTAGEVGSVASMSDCSSPGFAFP